MKTDSYLFNLIQEMHNILHRIEGYKDAQEYIKRSNLRFVEENEPKEIPFPSDKISKNNKKQP